MSKFTLNLMLWVLLYPALSSGKRCKILFPTVNTSVVYAEEGTSLTLPFTASASCRDLFHIQMLIEESDDYISICRFLIKDDSCRDSWGLKSWVTCDCLPERGRYQLHITVDRFHDGARILAENGGFIFNVTDRRIPANITSLTIASDNNPLDNAGVEENSSVV
ncbi:hypothetical protein BaRGS_00036228, partial [Batillaria attramentaria]